MSRCPQQKSLSLSLRGSSSISIAKIKRFFAISGTSELKLILEVYLPLLLCIFGQEISQTWLLVIFLTFLIFSKKRDCGILLVSVVGDRRRGRAFRFSSPRLILIFIYSFSTLFSSRSSRGVVNQSHSPSRPSPNSYLFLKFFLFL